MRSTCAIFQTPTPLTPPTSRATAVALGLTLSAATIAARLSGGFRLLEPRAAMPAVSSMPNVFAKAFPGEAIAAELNKSKNDPAFTQWDNFRNILAHRSAPVLRVIWDFHS